MTQILWHERPNGCGSWLPEDNKSNMWNERKKMLWLMAACLPTLAHGTFNFKLQTVILEQISTTLQNKLRNLNWLNSRLVYTGVSKKMENKGSVKRNFT